MLPMRKKDEKIIKSCVKVRADNLIELPQTIQERCQPGDIVCIASKIDETNPLRGTLKAWIKMTDGGKDIEGKRILEWVEGEGDEELQKELIRHFKKL